MRLRFALPTALLIGVALGAASVIADSSNSVFSRFLEPFRPVSQPLVLEAAQAEPAAHAVRWDIPVIWNEPVLRFVERFRSYPATMATYLKRSGRYEGMIRGKLRERGMPEDLFYLSMIESGFNPNARSHAQAVGLWQFVAETGRRYGLRIDSYVDERRDPEQSTDAALRYLSDLYSRFGSWNLAAAAYNSGENRIGRIMREETGSEQGEDADFWRIRKRLPRETRDYVPLIVAAALIGKQPEKYGMERVERWLPVSTEKVMVPGGTDLGKVARAIGVEKEELRILNPQLVRGQTPPGERYAVRIPEGRKAQFASIFGQARTRVGSAS